MPSVVTAAIEAPGGAAQFFPGSTQTNGEVYTNLSATELHSLIQNTLIATPITVGGITFPSIGTISTRITVLP